MTTRNTDNGGWEIIAETTPSGVSSVVHTGLEDYDWIYCSYQEVETSTNAYTVMQFGYGATPTYVNNFYVSGVNGTNYQYFNTANIYTRTANTTTDGRGTVLIPNMGRLENSGSNPMHHPFISGGYGTSTTYSTGNVGALAMLQVPLTAVKYSSTSGNMQGTGANIKTWGWRG